MSDKADILIVDLANMLRRAFHVSPPTAGKIVFDQVERFRDRWSGDSWSGGGRPKVILATDVAGNNSWRKDLYPAYGAKRVPLDPEEQRAYQDQLEELRALIWSDPTYTEILAPPGFEADDVIATLVYQAHQQGKKVVLLSSDKDFVQLLSMCTIVLPSGELRTEQSVWDKHHVRLEQWVDYQALCWDAVDGYPGVPRIGPVKAAQLLGKYQTLEAILDCIEEEKLVKHVIAHRESAIISKRLARLDREIPGITLPETT